MAFEATTPNMNLVLPGVGLTLGPQWATDINASLTIIDQHNHSAGNGVVIPTSGINVNADLSFGAYNATALRSVRLNSQVSALVVASDLRCVYAIGSDLYYNNGIGQAVQITNGASIAGAVGSIANLVSPASATYVGGSATFVWKSDTTIAANMDAGAILMRNITSNSKALTLSPPAAMGADYTLTLPSLPASTKIMQLDSSGNITGALAVDGSTITNAANTLQVPTGGITNTQIADATITGAKVAATTIAAANIVNATITGTQISSNINLPGVTVQAGGQNVVVAKVNAASSLAIIRVAFNSGGTLSVGEGATATHNSAGSYTVHFSVPFADTPVVQATFDGNIGAIAYLQSFSAGVNSVEIRTYSATFTPTDIAFSLIAVGRN